MRVVQQVGSRDADGDGPSTPRAHDESVRLGFVPEDEEDAGGGRHGLHAESLLDPAAKLLLVEEDLKGVVAGEKSVAVLTTCRHVPALVLQASRYHENLPGERPGATEHLSALSRVVDHVHHVAEVHDVCLTPGRARTRDGVPTVGFVVEPSQSGNVLPASTAVVEKGSRSRQNIGVESKLYGA